MEDTVIHQHAAAGRTFPAGGGKEGPFTRLGILGGIDIRNELFYKLPGRLEHDGRSGTTCQP